MIEKIVTTGAQYATVTEFYDITRVVFSDCYRYYHIRNDGEAVMKASLTNAELTNNADNVIFIQPKTAVTIYGNMVLPAVYVDRVCTIAASNDAQNPFRPAAKGGEILKYLEVDQNGEYLPNDYECDAFSGVSVNVVDNDLNWYVYALADGTVSFRLLMANTSSSGGVVGSMHWLYDADGTMVSSTGGNYGFTSKNTSSITVNFTNMTPHTWYVYKNSFQRKKEMGDGYLYCYGLEQTITSSELT